MNIVVVQPDSGTRPAEPRSTDDLLAVAGTLGVVETTVADAFEDAAAAWVPGEDVPFIVRRFAHPDRTPTRLAAYLRLAVAGPLGVVETTVADAFEDAAAAWVPGEDVPFIVRRFAHPVSWASLLERWGRASGRARV